MVVLKTTPAEALFIYNANNKRLGLPVVFNTVTQDVPVKYARQQKRIVI